MVGFLIYVCFALHALHSYNLFFSSYMYTIILPGPPVADCEPEGRVVLSSGLMLSYAYRPMFAQSSKVNFPFLILFFVSCAGGMAEGACHVLPLQDTGALPSAQNTRQSPFCSQQRLC